MRGIQQFAAVRAGAAKGGSKSLFDTDARQEDVSLELKGPGSDRPKYSLFLVDRDKPSSLKFAVFIVPQGRYVRALGEAYARFSSRRYSKLQNPEGCLPAPLAQVLPPPWH